MMAKPVKTLELRYPMNDPVFNNNSFSQEFLTTVVHNCRKFSITVTLITEAFADDMNSIGQKFNA